MAIRRSEFNILILFSTLQVFSKAKVMFSIGGTYYNGKTLSYSYMPDRVLENARNVTIRLHERLARFVKIRLYFADRWIMLSEVSFDAGKFSEIKLICELVIASGVVFLAKQGEFNKYELINI